MKQFDDVATPTLCLLTFAAEFEHVEVLENLSSFVMVDSTIYSGLLYARRGKVVREITSTAQPPRWHLSRL